MVRTAMRVLLVEDDERLSSSLARGLRGEGYAVDVAASGDEALLQARVYDYDVVVLDVMLPGPDGVAVCRVDLSAREFAVLEFLARRAGQVVSRSELLEHVWDRNYEGSTNIIDVYVGYLRRKLENPFGRPLIHTVRGVGYMIDQ